MDSRHRTQDIGHMLGSKLASLLEHEKCKAKGGRAEPSCTGRMGAGRDYFPIQIGDFKGLSLA